MKKNRSLNIRGTLLDRNQLSQYIEKVAAEHNVRSLSSKDTYPVPAVKEDYKFILETYRLLDKHIKLGIKIHSAGEWLLDNFYIILDFSTYHSLLLTLINEMILSSVKTLLLILVLSVLWVSTYFLILL